jgi:hypothetical protein
MVKVGAHREQHGAAGNRSIAGSPHLAQTMILDREEFE